MSDAQRDTCRFMLGTTPEGKPEIILELFHDTITRLSGHKIAFEILSGTTTQEANSLIEHMNDRIIGIVVAPSLRS